MFSLFFTFSAGTIIKHAAILSEEEVCNDNFVKSDTNHYVIENLEAGSYLCFQPFQITGSNADDPYVSSFIIHADNITLVNSTHTVAPGYGATENRIRIEATTQTRVEIFFIFEEKQIENENSLSQLGNYQLDIERYVVFEHEWQGTFSTQVTVQSDQSVVIKGKELILASSKGANISYTINYGQTESTESEQFTEVYKSIFPIPDSISSYIQSESQETLAEGTYTATTTLSIFATNHDDSGRYSWPEKTFKIEENTIYSDDVFDDYNLNGLHNANDDLCHSDFIDIDNIPTSLQANAYFCFKPFTKNNIYYDTIFIYDQNEKVVVQNTTDLDDNGMFISGFGGTGDRLKIRQKTDESECNFALAFFSSKSFYPYDDSINSSIDIYIASKRKWTANPFIDYDIETNTIKSISGKYVHYFNPLNDVISVKPNGSYVPLFSSDFSHATTNSLVFTNETQESSDIQRHEGAILPHEVYNLLFNNEDINNSAYHGEINIEIKESNETTNSYLFNKVIKLTSNTLYDSNTFDDVNLDGVEHSGDDDTIDPDRKRLFLIVVCVAVIIILIIFIIICCCRRAKKRANAEKSTSSSSSLDEDAWIIDKESSKYHGKKSHKKKRSH